MLPTLPMLVTKNLPRHGAILFLALAVFISGCTPPGPRALLKGKKLLERGDYAAAVDELKTATTLLPANAQAWNYLGVACQHAGDTDDAVAAYQRALVLDRDLMEAHYNLGLLWLGLNKFDSAKTEFTAYTLRHNNAPEGWLKLGSAQLRAGDFVMAEKSFSTALYLNQNNAEALNGLGLARIQRGRPREAAQFFAAAAQDHPDYAPAILNLATVEQQYLHDNRSALEHYRAYLAFTPHPENWDAVNEIANGLEPSAAVAVANLPPANQNQNAAQNPPLVMAKTQPMVAVRPETSPHTVTHVNPNPPPHPAQVVKIQPEPVIVSPPERIAAETETPPEAPEKPGVLHKLNPANWFDSSAPEKKFDPNGVTPLPEPGSENSRAVSTPLIPPSPAPVVANPPAPAPAPVPVVAPPKPVKIIPPAAPTFPRYLYLSPRKPKTGDRQAASLAFTKAREFEQDSHWPDAMDWYRRATEADPTWFEARYNYGVMAYRLRDFSAALAAYETALVIRPDSADARYNFALALKAAGYPVDAVNELKKVAAASPGEVRAHLALGNLYAQQLRDPARARPHYMKVLELDPRNPQATDIRFWLSSNPP
jgi:tetratricopeptide (TPR) repeat protein